MKSLDTLTAQEAGKVSFLLTDIDDTMTYRGKLLPEAYTALWNLSRAGIHVIPVTGRPAGWCDLIARFWPVAGVIGENGALAFYMEENRMKRLYHPLADRKGAKKRLDGLWEQVRRAVPESRIAADQFSRLFDLAVDYREEPPLLDDQAAEAIKKACEDQGARAKISSIHVNAWFGDYDKLSMTHIFFSQRYPEANLASEVLFVGDSPNDEPMFAFFPFSCGVGNIRNFLPFMKAQPAFITSGEGSFGFAELAEKLLSL